ncbi:hypothetical protein NPX13_g6271 [Xylaria arbuscula]|uniref:NACHT domain-containing protein n=1 Tax=Xylaria arbuscula TaxID=114810 RepID=A0A9W8TLK6_9PEZI|nr:hypothetical protein NPX13_g6271 [Xylaria arbuscula]
MQLQVVEWASMHDDTDSKWCKMLKGLKEKLRGKRPDPANTVDDASASTSTTSRTISSPSLSQSASIRATQAIPERFGLFYLNESAPDSAQDDRYPVDIIAIHGLNGNADTTWTHENGTMWVRDILPGFIPGCRVYTYGYPSEVAFSSSLASVKDVSRGLLSAVRDLHEDTGKDRRSIIFLCHSLGGIVCKQALIFAHSDADRYGSLMRCVIGLVFLGTPHRGSEVADLGRTVGTIINMCSKVASAGLRPGVIRSDLLKHLNYDAKVLEDLALEARNRMDNMMVVSFYENEPTPPPPQSSFRARPMRAKPDLTKACMIHFNIFNLTDYKRRLPKPIQGTCQWIRAHSLFASWLKKAGNALLWLTGYPGCGKTMLSYSLAKQLEETSQNVLIYFCDNKISTQRDSKAVLIGLIAQLIDRHHKMARHIRRVFEIQNTSMLHSFSALWSIFERITQDLESSSLYIIIDGLDECEGSSWHDLLSSIHELVDASTTTTGGGKHIKFLLTSRPTLGQASITNPLRKHQLPIHDGQPGYGDDLRIFIEQKIDEITQRRGCTEETRQFLLQALLSRADQTFLWIHMVLASLEQSALASINDFRAIINKIPPDLEATYLNFLSAIPFHHQHSAWQLLGLLFASAKPLLLDELNIAFTVKPSHSSVEDVLQNCQPAMDHTVLGILGPLVRISESKVSFVHQTVKDFLLVEDGNEQAKRIHNAYPEMPAITQQSSALYMATACIHYLLLSEFSTDLYAPENSPTGSSFSSSESSDSSPTSVSYGGFWEDDTQDLNEGSLFCEQGAQDTKISLAISSKYAFYNYASLHWADHFALCEPSAPRELKDAANSLLDVETANCQNWLRFCWSSEVANFPGNEHRGSNSLSLAAYFDLQVTLVDLLEHRDPSQLEKDQALFWGARAGNGQIIAILLKAGANPNHNAAETQTALIIAAAHGYIECVALLLESGRCDVNLKGKYGATALSFAAGNGHYDVVECLLSRSDCKADESDSTGSTPLMWAVRGGHALVVSMVTKQPSVDVNRRDKTGRTAVSWAAGDGIENVLKGLLKLRSVDANVPDNKGRTPLSWAASNGHAGAAKILTRSKRVEKDKVDQDGRNPISWACGHGHETTLRVLLKHGCKGFDDADVDGWTPLAWAIQKDSPGVVEALIAAGVDDLEKGTRTVLSWAVEYGHLPVVRVLLREGADPESALDRIPLAQATGRYDLINELQFYMNRKSDTEQRVE